VLLPQRNRASDYWFRLRTDATRSILSYRLQGNPVLVPAQTRTLLQQLYAADNRMEIPLFASSNYHQQLPFGFIHRKLVHLFEPVHRFVYTFPYLEMSNQYEVGMAHQNLRLMLLHRY